MKKVKNIGILYLFLQFFWLVFTDFSPGDSLIIGAVFSAAAAFVFGPRMRLLSELRFTPRAFLYSLIYPFIFLKELVMANLDVASRVIKPVIPINPGIVKVRTVLKSRLGRIILANSITLTPGTLTVETDGTWLFIHWIDITSPDIEETTRIITGKFEKYLEVIFG